MASSLDRAAESRRLKVVKLYSALSSAALVAFAWGGAVDAQVAQPQVPPSGDPVAKQAARASDTTTGHIEEVVVTARRREELVSRTPVTVQVLSATALRSRSVTSELDLPAAVPGLVVTTSQTNEDYNYAVRGQSVDPFTDSLPAVPVYLNEVPVPSVTPGSLYDLQNIQVLKGPQGTLFGLNATGGAVLFQSAAPNLSDTAGYIQGRFGNLNRLGLQGVINVPITDTLAVRFAADVDRRDGYLKNLTDGSYINSYDRKSIRGSVLWKPTSNLSNTLVVQYDDNRAVEGELIHHIDLPGTSYQAGGVTYPYVDLAATLYTPAVINSIYGPGAFNTYLAAHPQTTAGGLAQYAVIQQNEKGEVALNSPLNDGGLNVATTDTTVYQFSGGPTLKEILGFAHSDRSLDIDFDGTPFTFIHGDYIKNNQSYSSETQLSDSILGGMVNYTTGIFLSNLVEQNAVDTLVFDTTPFGAPGLSIYDGHERYNSEAVFGQSTVKLDRILQGLSFTIGGRYTWEQVKAVYITPLPGLLSKCYSDPRWDFGLEYQISPALLLYGVQRGSWRSGGFNLTSRPIDASGFAGGATFTPETTTDFEIGAKYNDRFYGIPLRFSIAGYNQLVEHIQRTQNIAIPGFGFAGITVNVPGIAEFKGVEGDVAFSPTSWLNIGGGFAYLDAEFGKPGLVVFYPNTPDQYGTIFNTVANAPKWTENIYIEWSAEQVPSSYGKLTARADYSHQSDFYISNNGTTSGLGSLLPGYGILNFRVDWRHVMDTPVDVSFFMRNALDKYYFSGGTDLSTQVGETVVNVGEPRTFGVELRYSFGSH